VSEGQAKFLSSLERTALEPGAAWRQACDALAVLAGATGTLIIPADAGVRGRAMPHSEAIGETVHRFVAEGWHRNDFRAEKGFPVAARKGFVTDADIIAPEEMDRHIYYQELLRPGGLMWFLGVPFAVEGRTWGAALHRTPAQGAFTADEVGALLWVSEHLALAAKRTALLGHGRMQSLDAALSECGRAVAALGPGGRVTRMNAAAERLLEAAGILSRGRLRSGDIVVDSRLQDLAAAASSFDPAPGTATPRPVLVNAGGRAFSLDAIPMPRDVQALFSGVAALVTIHEVIAGGAAFRRAAKAHLGLTQREAELAAELAAGNGLLAASSTLGVSILTARKHLKSIFFKTGTNSQVELVAKLARLMA
jgi:DNA-binding CsgD family transcriptional regulator